MDLSLLGITYYLEKNCLDKIGLHSYALISNAMIYEQTRLAFPARRAYFLFGHFTLQESCHNIFAYTRICTSSKVTSFSLSEATSLLMNKVFSYRFLTREVKRINFKR